MRAAPAKKYVFIARDRRCARPAIRKDWNPLHEIQRFEPDSPNFESRRVKFSASNRHFSIQLVIFYADFFFFAILSRRSAHASPRRRTLHVSPCANPDFYGIITPKAAVYTAARVQGTRPCADAQGFGNIEPCKTAAGAVLLWPLCGVMV